MAVEVPQIDLTFNPPLSGDTGATFDAAAFDTVAKLQPLTDGINVATTFIDTRASAANAAAIAGGLSELDLLVSAGYFIAVNDDGDAIEAVDINEVAAATSGEAQAGTDDAAYMTPLKTFEAIPAALNATGTAPVFGARAWVNFDGTGSITVRGSGNVASVTRIGVGHYRITFTTDMPSVNYAVSGTAADTQSYTAPDFSTTLGAMARTVSYVDVSTVYQGAGLTERDAEEISVVIFG